MSTELPQTGPGFHCLLGCTDGCDEHSNDQQMDDHFSLINDKQEAVTRWGLVLEYVILKAGLIPWTPRYFQKSLSKSLGVFSPVGNVFSIEILGETAPSKKTSEMCFLDGWMEICDPQFGLKQILKYVVKLFGLGT